MSPKNAYQSVSVISGKKVVEIKLVKNLSKFNLCGNDIFIMLVNSYVLAIFNDPFLNVPKFDLYQVRFVCLPSALVSDLFFFLVE